MGYIIGGSESAAYVEHNQRFSVAVNRIGQDRWGVEYGWSVWSYGDLVASRDGMTGRGDPDQALAFLLGRIVEDIAHWQMVERDGLCPIPFATCPDVARWASVEAEELERAATAAMLWTGRRTT